jgi:transposase-like protein
MNNEKRTTIRYSEAFKHQVIREIEEGKRTIPQATKVYGIKGVSTIRWWMKRMGKLNLLPTIVRVENPNEKDRIKELERQVKELKNALADTQVQCLIAESRFEVVCEEQGWDPEEVKKKLKDAPSSKQEKKKK